LPAASAFVHCVCETPAQSTSAVEALVSARFPVGDISVLAADDERHEELVAYPHAAVAQVVAPGGLTGTSLGLAWASVQGFGIGLRAAGPIVGALRALEGGALIGGLPGALAGLGYWQVDADLPVTAIQKGGILVGVHVPDDRIGEAAEVLRACGADLVHVN
jgi:hypothetical protein